MNGADSLVQSLLAGGVDVCFTNPGTSEMHMVAALDREPRLRPVLALFEGVVTGAADGYARMTGRPACTLLHLGPGLANGLANLHNAGRAHSPVVNIIGQHALSHIPFDTPLTADIEGIGRPYSKWLRTSRSSSALGQDIADAIVASRTSPGQIATLIVPADVAWSDGGVAVSTPNPARPTVPETRAIESIAQKLRTTKPCALLITDSGLFGPGLRAAGRIAAATNATIFAPYPFPRLEHGADLPPVERIPYVREQAVERLKDFKLLVLVGAPPPMSYFAAPNTNSAFSSPQCEVAVLAEAQQDITGALEALATALDAKKISPLAETAKPPAAPAGKLTFDGIAAAIASQIPEHAIVVDESMTSGRAILTSASGAPPHDFLANTGGSIGIAMPLALGAAVACPDRKVLCLSADGSGMYTLQALWSMAREGANVTTVIFSNRSYNVLKREYSYLGVGAPGEIASKLFSIGDPDLDWVSLARGMGVPATRVDCLEQLTRSLQGGLNADGPSVIEIPL
jgi:acetolactate synthase I/II/III large subunit